MMNYVKIATILMVGLGLSACSKIESSPLPENDSFAAKVTIDLSTPDKAIKSYWAVRDSVRANYYELTTERKIKLNDIKVQMESVSEGVLAKELTSFIIQPEKFSRDILDVKIESESRAVIIAVIKNSTPIPMGAELTKDDEELRGNGERYRYILEKTQAGWRVSEIWNWSIYPSKDWRKFSPTDDKPSVPSLTYGGI